MNCTIKLLGEVVVLVNGRSSRIVDSARGVALLAYLVYTNDVQSRERVADLLWEASSTKQSLARLRELLGRVRKWLPQVQTTRQTVTFQADEHTSVDLWALRNGLQSEDPTRLDEALQLYVDDFLANFYLGEGLYFNEWLIVTRERLRQEVLAAHERLCGLYAAQESWPKGIEVARRWVALAPFREEAHRWLMQMLAQNGQVTAAWQAYHTCCQILEEELGVEPEAETTTLAQQLSKWGGETAVVLTIIPLEQLKADRLSEPGLLPANTILPYQRNQDFVGRGADLLRLAHLLADERTDDRIPVAAITGMGGLGKTQTAVEFCYRYGRYFPGGVYWLNFDEAENVAQEVASSGGERGLGLFQESEQLTLADKVGRVQKAWQEPSPRLLIFDNCETEALLTAWLPVTGGCRIILTSRRGHWSRELAINSIALNVLKRVESVALLQRLAPRLSEAEAAEIAQEVGHLPLALHVAGGFLRRYRQITPKVYLTQLRDKNLLDHPSLQGRGLSYSPTNHELHVGRTLALNIDQLDPADGVDEKARELLVRAVCFAPGEPIPRALLQETVLAEAEDLTAVLLAEDGLVRLTALGFVKTEGAEWIVVHRLIAAFLLADLATDEALVRAQTAVETVLLKRIDAYQQQDHLLVQLPFSAAHLQHVVKVAWSRLDERAARLATAWGYHLYLNSDLTNAGSYLARAREICEQVYGLWHRETAVAFSRDGWVHMHSGDYAGAEARYQQALAIHKALAEPDPLQLASCYRDLGSLHWRQGKYAEARGFHEQELALREAALGSQHPLTAQSFSSLGIILGQMGHLEEARAYQERALTAVVNEPETTDTARLLNNLATTCSRLGDLAAALQYARRSLRIRERIFGAMNRTTAYSQNNLGMLLIQLGAYEEARPHLEQALAVRQALLGTEHLLTARSLCNLGDLQRRLGQYGVAQENLETAVAIYEALRPTHAQIAQTLNHLGDLFLARGELETARLYLDRALAIWEEHHNGRSDIAHTLISLGGWFQAMGDVAAARQSYQQAAEILEDAVLPSHPDKLRVDSILAQMDTG